MIFKHYSLLNHGQGSLRQWSVGWRFRGKLKCLRFSIGGYGNSKRPFGTWCLVPRVKVYTNQAYYLRWFSAGLCFLSDCSKV
jgi:hypothetical protein